MNREDITRMAREAGFVGMDGEHGALRRFATLVASAEREACAKVCEEHGKVWADRTLLGFQATLNDAAEAIRARGQA